MWTRAKAEYDEEAAEARYEYEMRLEAEAEALRIEAFASELADILDRAETGCAAEEIAAFPRIERKPVQFVRTAQGNLFPKEIA